MRSYVVFSSMGPDRPGLVREIAEFFSARGINIERSRGCVLGNEFGMVILTSGNSENIEGLIKDLDSLRQEYRVGHLHPEDEGASPQGGPPVDCI